MSRLFRNPFRSAIILFVISLLLAVAAKIISGPEKNPDEQLSDAGNNFERMHEEVSASLNYFRTIRSAQEKENFFVTPGLKSKGYSYYLLVKGKLVRWSDNEPTIQDSLILPNYGREPILPLSNGEFYLLKKSWNDTILAGLILIRHNYDYQNKYLVNNFNPQLALDNFKVVGNGLVEPSLASKEYVAPPAGYKEFSFLSGQSYHLQFQPLEPEPVGATVWLWNTIVFLWFIIIFLLLRKFAGTNVGFILSVLLIIGLRTLMIQFHWPSILYSQKVFDPVFYASSFFFNSLGDFLINSVLILVLAINIYEKARPYRKARALLIIYWMLAAFGVHYLIRGLVINSRISFELTSSSNITIYSIIAYSCISFLLLSFLFITAALGRNIRSYSINGRHAWVGIFICALYTAVAISQLNVLKEKEDRKLLAQKAEARRDHIAEFLFKQQEQKIQSDSILKVMLHESRIKSNEINSYVASRYLSGYFSKYIPDVNIFDISATTDSSTGVGSFLEQAANGRRTESDNLFFVSNESGGVAYLAFIPLEDQLHRHMLVLTLTPRLFRSTKGFPELLVSGTFQEQSPDDEYSIARYSSNSLVYQYGEFVYPLTGKEYSVRQDNEMKELNGYSHLVHILDANSFIVVSRKATSTLSALTLFSWMFVFMSLGAFAIFVLSGIMSRTSTAQWNLQRKIQTSVIFLMVLIFALVGSGTVYYIKTKYQTDQNKSISDQVNALWFLVNDNLSFGNMAGISEEQSAALNRVVGNTNIDFNLYNNAGRIIYSSQPRIFREGIISDRMNPRAYLKITREGLTQFIHPERTGQLRFIAAYAPFTDRAGKITAFINLPYFEKQNELNKEVSVFLSAIINIYVLLFALAVFVTIFISSRITKPLLLIQEKMSGIRLGSLNEKIGYKPNDEIGQLVHEYNRMIDELAASADKLARSERESAWREMARQVAHEIKNPLTPMKLSVQHLQRTLSDGTDKATIDRITSTLINQIDSLSNIATAFSNFAKMPQAAPKHIDLREILIQVIELYGPANIHLESESGTFFVYADRDQLTGVFSNLLKNALQSVPSERKAEVKIRLRRDHGGITTEISDNGIGIPEDQKDKIFIPNFTTKSSGMGLGLAIARKTVEEANGNIWFTSIYGTGSSFFVTLPEDKGQN